MATLVLAFIEPNCDERPMKVRAKWPNRIREIRTSRQWSAEKLGKLCSTSQQQIQRLESGERRLTQEWMERISKALRVAPADLLPDSVTKPTKDDVVVADLGVPSAMVALAQRQIGIYRLLTDCLSALGYEREQIITIDKSKDAITGISDCAVALVSVQTGEDGPAVIVRQFVRPRVLLTHPRSGSPGIVVLDDPVLRPVIIGVLVKEERQPT